MTLLGVALGLAGNFWRRVEQQRRAVSIIEGAGGRVSYNYEFGMGKKLEYQFQLDHPHDTSPWNVEVPASRKRLTAAGFVTDADVPPGPRFIRRLLGENVFANVEEVDFRSMGSPGEPPGPLDLHLFQELPELKLVTLSSSQINDELIGQLSQLRELRILRLLGNDEERATGNGLRTLKAAGNLEVLTLSGEWVTDDIVAATPELKKLRALHLYRTPNVTSASFAAVATLPNLQELTIHRAEKIDDRGSEHLAELRELRRLWLSATGCSDIAVAHVSKLPNLQCLSLAKSKITDVSMEHLKRSRSIQQLDLSDTSIGDIGLESIVQIPRLRVLILNGTRVTDSGMPIMVSNRRLQRLDIDDTTITDEGVIQLKALTDLRRLHIGPKITDDMSNELAKSLNGCEVVHTLEWVEAASAPQSSSQ